MASTSVTASGSAYVMLYEASVLLFGNNAASPMVLDTAETIVGKERRQAHWMEPSSFKMRQPTVPDSGCSSMKSSTLVKESRETTVSGLIKNR